MFFATPEFFGCSSKLPISRTLTFSEIANRAFPTRSAYCDAFPDADGNLSSIDKVFRCVPDPLVFAKLALAHCTNDITCLGSLPRFVQVVFDFGEDLTTQDENSLVEAFCQAVSDSGLVLGKCHSTKSMFTALTIAIQGTNRGSKEGAKTPNEGNIILLGEFGAIGKLYEAAMEREYDHINFLASASVRHHRQIEEAVRRIVLRGDAIASDVSGFGVAGAIESLAGEKYLIEVATTAEHSLEAAAGQTADCMVNSADDFVRAWKRPFRLKQTMGPFILFLDSKVDPRKRFAGLDWVHIGKFTDC